MLHPGWVVEHQSASSCRTCRSVVVRRTQCRRKSCPYVCWVSSHNLNYSFFLVLLHLPSSNCSGHFLHSLVLPDNVTVFLWQRSSFLQRIFSGEIPQPFLSNETSRSNLFTSLWYSFLVILLVRPSIFQFLPSLAGTLASSKTWIGLNIFRTILPTCSCLQQFLNFGPRLSLAYPEHFLHHIRTSPCLSFLLTRS